MDLLTNQSMNQIYDLSLKINPVSLFGGGGSAAAMPSICVLLKTNNPVNKENLHPVSTMLLLLSESDVLLIKNWSISKSNQQNRILSYVIKAAADNKTKPVINPWTPMTWTWLGPETVNYSVVQEQYCKPDEFMLWLESLWVKANIPDPLVPGEYSSWHAATLCHDCEYITSVCLASAFKCLVLILKWLFGFSTA